MRIISCTAIAAFIVAGPAIAAPETFPTPQDALDAFVAALRSEDQARVIGIFGDEARDLLSSGDPDEDAANRAEVLRMYAEGYRFQPDGEGVDIILGEDSWPFPIPIARTDDGWQFDVEAGFEEIAARRIGFNELDVVELLDAYVDLQAAFRLVDQNGDGVMEFARQIISDPGKRNGLFWPDGEGYVGAALARAAMSGWSDGDADYEPDAFMGYVFTILHEQGPHAPGGAYSYLAGNHLVGGHAMLAVPAEYGETGIHSFVVGENGVVYQADFGPDTLDLTAELKAYDPGADWSPVE